jgi:hypothetical protein
MGLMSAVFGPSHLRAVDVPFFKCQLCLHSFKSAYQGETSTQLVVNKNVAGFDLNFDGSSSRG